VIHDAECDLVIMNPPFTRPTNHESTIVPVPSFAGFGTSNAEQKAMSRKLKASRCRLLGSGHAGLASNFMDLVHIKLKPGGTLAMVLPFSFAAGGSWKNARSALDKYYHHIRVIGIASHGTYDRAFSADTGMAECLLIATKRSKSTVIQGTQFSSILRRPRSLLEASDVAKRIWEEQAFEDSILDCGGVAVLHKNVADTARDLSRGQLRLPRETKGTPMAIVPLGEVSDRGLVDRNISARSSGPFDLRRIKKGEVPTYPVLWAHNAKKERRFWVQPDRCGEVRPGQDVEAQRVWDTASRLHSNRDFQLNSQSLAMCLTREKCVGGTAWPNLSPHKEAYTFPMLLWANSTLGLILFWYHGTRQQQGRARLTISRLPAHPILDPRALTADQREWCRAIFQDFERRDFLPANEAYRDPARQELDAALFSMLGIDRLENLALLRRQWCAEPSVHGGKSTRP